MVIFSLSVLSLLKVSQASGEDPSKCGGMIKKITNRNGIEILSAEANTQRMSRLNAEAVVELVTKTEELKRIQDAISPKKAPGPDRTLVYVEDNQGYSHLSIVFRTNFPGTVEQLERLSYATLEAGRFSTSYFTFRELLVTAGYTCEFVSAGETDAPPPEGYPVVIGATGNY